MLAAIGLLAGAILLFAELADDVAEGDAKGFDWAVLQLLHPDDSHPENPVGPGWLDHAAADLSALGSVAVLSVVTFIAAGFLILRRRQIEALLVALALGGGIAISQSLKAIFARERPPDIYRSAEILNASFPSGHAMLSAVVYLSLGAMLARATSRPGIRVYIIAVAIALALLVGLTRVYLGVHWASDVLAGWCAGAAWATAWWLIDRWARNRWGNGEARG